MRYDFLGVVTTISDLTSFTNSKGESVPKRMVLLTTEERVPQSVSVELIGELAQKFRLVGEIEHHHEERYRALLHNIEMAEVFAKSEVKVWECRNCGHIVVGTKAPQLCPVCAYPQSYFELRKENY